MSDSEQEANRDPPAGVELPPPIRRQLLDPSLWQEGLQRYAQATNLAVVLTDADGRQLGECINPRPTWSLLHAHRPAGVDPCPFSLIPPRPCTCVANALNKGGMVLAPDRTGLAHFAVPLVLGGHRLGALVAGQVFAGFPEQLALEYAARHFGVPSQLVWDRARLEHPVKQVTLRVYANLLTTLADRTLQSRYHALLEADRLAEMTQLRDQLQERTRELTEADHRKDQFLAMLAHELRNPLATIRNAVQVMRHLSPNDAHLEWEQMVERHVQHLSRMVDDLLDVSRFTTGKITLQKEPTDLAAVAARALQAIRPAVEERGQELSCALPPERLPVEGDPVRLAQVLTNLLNNAAKYTPEQGRIWLTAGRENGEAVVKVRDTGIGMAADLLAHVFDPFTQADRTLDRAQGGLGIGLTLVKSLVELHGGHVHAFSAGPGQGSEFMVRLPLMTKPLPLPEDPDEDDRESAPGPARRILVVDDIVDSAESLAVLLRLQGHEVKVAYDGTTALAAAQAAPPEVVLLDIGLPGMDGYQVARRLRQQPALRKTLVVALTGYGQEEDRRRCQEAGIDQHLVKPVNLTTLNRLLAGP
jgi:signal transduction histidine kinase